MSEESYVGFRCRECGSLKLIETMKDVVVTSFCSIGEENIEYHNQSNEGGEVVGYQCENGHNVMNADGQVVTTEEELISMLPILTCLSFDDVVALLAARLSHLTGQELVEEYDRVFPQTIEYVGDSMFIKNDADS